MNLQDSFGYKMMPMIEHMKFYKEFTNNVQEKYNKDREQ